MPEYHYPGDNGLSAEPLDWWTRLRLRAPWWPYVVLAMLFGCWYFWKYRSPAVAMKHMTPLDDYLLAVLFFGLLAIMRGAQVLVRISTEIACGASHQFFRLRNWCMPWLFLIAAVIYFGIGEQWPMRVGFWLSCPAFDRLANEALADPPKAYLLRGRWVGLYYIDKVEVSSSTVALFLDADKGTSGFVLAPKAKLAISAVFNYAELINAEGVYFQEGKQLGDDWYAFWGNNERG
jgi:hypothetical protein